MNTTHLVRNRYRQILIASVLSSTSLLALLPALADQNSPTPGTKIENQATAEFTDSADTTNTPIQIVSDTVKVTVAEVAGISAAGSAIVNPAYRTNTVYFDFIVKNEGNDPTQLFIPAAPSVATLDGVDLPGTSIGQLQVIQYNDVNTTTPVTANNLVDPTTGSVTGGLSGIPNGGSVPAGGYIKVRVPITLPFTAVTGKIIRVTLGNTAGQTGTSNIPYVVGANGTGGNDLYTKDNADGTNSDTTGVPLNGDGPLGDGNINLHRQEATATQQTTVVDPPTITIKGTAWDDANGSGTSTFTSIKDGTETFANVAPAINAILVDKTTNKVLATTPVAANGTYTLSTFGVQNNLYVMLSTSTGSIGIAPPAADLPTTSTPTNWTNTTPLTYLAVPFNVAIANIIDIDFGLDRLPETIDANAGNQLNPPGTDRYQVPTLTGSDAEDTTGTVTTLTKVKILSVPNPLTKGTLYYNNLAVTANQVINGYDPTKLTFDPLDGPISMSFTYAAIDAAGKEDPTPATATMLFSATPIGISGTIWNDKDKSANNSFVGIQTNGEVGTDTVFGTTTTPINAVLVNITTGKVIGSQVVSSTGLYNFPSVPAQTDVKVILSATAGSIGSSTLPLAGVTDKWVNTSPVDSGTFNTGLYPITGKDFGVIQKAKLVLLKRITKINGLTTNPNDNKVLTGVATTDTFNNVGHWPTNYIVGDTDGGKVKPGDTIEYTIYFLNNQGADAKNVKICDPIRGSQTYNSGTLELKLGTSPAIPLTDTNDSATGGADRGMSYPAGNAPTDCNALASSSADPGIAVGITGTGNTIQPDKTGVPGATGVGAPDASYGLFRFTTTVKP
jgi:hypothetical protein